jgi:hypothetical protein
VPELAAIDPFAPDRDLRALAAVLTHVLGGGR